MKKTYIWNTIAYILYAFQSPIMLFAISHNCAIEDAGIFSFAFALASLFLCFASFGMRNYQIADLSNRFSFWEYKASRLISFVTSLLIVGGYLFWGFRMKDYSNYKITVIALVCIFKLVEAGEDVFHGCYQKKGALIDAARLLTYRLSTALIVFFVIIGLTKNLLIALTISTLYSYLFAVITNFYTLRKYKQEKQRKSFCNVKTLFYECLPLCISQILSIYITNASKYAIDGVLSEREQACYGYLSLPVFGIALLSNIIFTPLLTTYARYWKDNEIVRFTKEIIKRFLIIGVITAGVMIFGKLIGLELISIIYGVDLSEYEMAFMLLLLAGGIMAVCNSLNFAITVIGYQKLIVWAYVGDAFILLLLAGFIVRKGGILGAAVFMCISFSILLLCLVLIFTAGVYNSNNKKLEN